jgi:hypothetical protein
VIHRIAPQPARKIKASKSCGQKTAYVWLAAALPLSVRRCCYLQAQLACTSCPYLAWTHLLSVCVSAASSARHRTRYAPFQPPSRRARGTCTITTMPVATPPLGGKNEHPWGPGNGPGDAWKALGGKKATMWGIPLVRRCLLKIDASHRCSLFVLLPKCGISIYPRLSDRWTVHGRTIKN